MLLTRRLVIPRRIGIISLVKLFLHGELRTVSQKFYMAAEEYVRNNMTSYTVLQIAIEDIHEMMFQSPFHQT